MSAMIHSRFISTMSDRSASIPQPYSEGPDERSEAGMRSVEAPTMTLTATQIQDIIYQYLIRAVQTMAPEAVLDEFYRLFIEHQGAAGTQALHAIYQLVFLNNQEAFQAALKRSCYILINNWASCRQEVFIYRLISLFERSYGDQNSSSISLNRLRKWVYDFVNSHDYDELKLFIARHELDYPGAPYKDSSGLNPDRTRLQIDHSANTITDLNPEAPRHWSSRYIGQLLVAQAVDPNNPLEQREAATVYARQWRERFKFDLAMYMAKYQSTRSDRDRLRNPTNLGDQVLKIVKSIVLRTGKHSYSSLASLFLQQTQGLKYRGYKKSLLKYLILENTPDHMTELVRQKLQEKLTDLMDNQHDEALTEDLHHETCRYLIEFLTTEDLQSPSRLFLLILSNGSALTLTIFLLKLVLICPATRSHLDLCIARLVKYYEQFDEESCYWVIYFFDIFNVTFAIYTENVQYNLVSVDDQPAQSDEPETEMSQTLQGLYDNQLRRSLKSAQLDRYRLFLQIAPHPQLPQNNHTITSEAIEEDVIAPENSS
ncbi:MAG TPA: hypothetical protein V6D46_04485 [Coleofasciculaceae cyanobacterium]